MDAHVILPTTVDSVQRALNGLINKFPTTVNKNMQHVLVSSLLHTMFGDYMFGGQLRKAWFCSNVEISGGRKVVPYELMKKQRKGLKDSSVMSELAPLCEKVLGNDVIITDQVHNLQLLVHRIVVVRPHTEMTATVH